MENLKAEVQMLEGQSKDEALASLIVAPSARHSFIHYNLARSLFNEQRPDFTAMIDHIDKLAKAINPDNLGEVSRLLFTQATTLDALFTDMTHRALNNAGQFPDQRSDSAAHSMVKDAAVLVRA